MYKLTLYFEDKPGIVFELHNLEELDNLLKTYPEYKKLTLENLKTLDDIKTLGNMFLKS